MASGAGGPRIGEGSGGREGAQRGPGGKVNLTFNSIRPRQKYWFVYIWLRHVASGRVTIKTDKLTHAQKNYTVIPNCMSMAGNKTKGFETNWDRMFFFFFEKFLR